MAPPSTGPDAADLDLLAALKSHARVEVEELTARLGLSHRRIRVRMRRLERSGLIRGYHAVAAIPETAAAAAPALAMVRFAAGPRPRADDIREMRGVRRVYTLCSTWDFMIEFTDGGQTVLGDASSSRGMVELLGTRAEFEVLAVRSEHIGSPRAYGESQTIAPFLGLVLLMSAGMVLSPVLVRAAVDAPASPERAPLPVRDLRIVPQPAPSGGGLAYPGGES
ncbi:MAG: winged helix-turn-helix transcriptional regulator [Geodermatophilaceae bacterium]|nr:winged helix-turn-helix transcriptional regulator [Geodermatophilaceae bacterium]